MALLNLLLSGPQVDDLDSFVAQLSRAIAEIRFEERESDNYVDDRYFLATHDGVELIAAQSDEDEHEDLPWWLVARAPALDDETLAAWTDRLFAQRLRPAGFEGARFVGFGRTDEQRLEY